MRYVILREGREIPVDITERPGGYRVALDGEEHLVESLEVVPGLYSLLVDGRSFEVTVHKPSTDLYHVDLHDGMRPVELVHPMALLLRRMGSSGEGKAGVVKAPMPGKVVRVMAKPGDTVEKGSGLLVLEAMKMQNQIQALGPGEVAEVRVSEGDSVDGGQVLAVIHPRSADPSP
jgi:biotin carboxyl carrier protein